MKRISKTEFLKSLCERLAMKMGRQTFNELTCDGSVMRFCQEMAVVGPVFDGGENLKPLISYKDYLTFKYNNKIKKVFNQGRGDSHPSTERTCDGKSVLDCEGVDERMMVYFRKIQLLNERNNE